MALGIVLRCLWPSGFLFRQDEAQHLADSLAISRGGERPVHAWPSSAGLPNGPVYLYFLAGVTRFTTDPRAAQGALTALNILALAASVPLFRRWLKDPRDATTAVALYATSPVAIWFSRKIWDPCLLPVLCVPALLLATRTVQSPRSRAPAALLPLLAVIAQVHQSGVVFAIVTLAGTAKGLVRAAPAALVLGFALAAAAVAPYAAHLADLFARGALVAHTRSPWPDVDVVTNLLLDATGHNILQTAGLAARGLLLWPVPPLGLLIQLAAVPFAITFGLGYMELLRPRAWALSADVRPLLIALAIALPGLFLLLRVQGAAHYFLAPLPVLFALLVLGARRAAASARALVRRWPPISALVVLNAASWLCFQSYVSVHRGSASYGLPYGDVMHACEAMAGAARALGRGTPEAPLTLLVDVPRDRGPLPWQYRYLLEQRLGITVRAPDPATSPDLVLRVRWDEGRTLPWTVLPGS